ALASRWSRAAALRRVRMTVVSEHTVRLTVLPLGVDAVPSYGALVREDWGEPVKGAIAHAGHFQVRVLPDPIAFHIASLDGQTIQEVRVDSQSGAVSFLRGDAPL